MLHGMQENRPGRARPMSRDERRIAIAVATIPLLELHGAQVSTRQIAEAAGVAEGTLFRAFDDKVELLHAAAERAVDPASAVAEIDGLPDAGSLPAELQQVVEVLTARGRRIRRVMVGVHGIMASDAGSRVAAIRRARGADVQGRPVPGYAPRDPDAPEAPGPAGRPHPFPPGPLHPGAGRDARSRALTELRGAVERRVEPYRDELRIEPERLAHILLAAIMGQGPPALPEDAEMPVADLVDVLLHGAART
jgi:AcrR family transcriptional regulator